MDVITLIFVSSVVLVALFGMVLAIFGSGEKEHGTGDAPSAPLPASPTLSTSLPQAAEPELDYEPDPEADDDPVPPAESLLAIVSPIYFRQCEELSADLMRYLVSLDRDKRLVDVARSLPGNETLTDVHGHNGVLTFFFLHDLTICVQRLGHNIDTDQVETLPLLFFVLKLLESEVPPSYANLDLLNNMMHKSLVTMLQLSTTVATHNGGPQLEFYTQFLMEQSAPERVDDYRKLLYDFSSAIATADGATSDVEAAFIDTLLPARAAAEPASPGEPAAAEPEADPMRELQELIGLDTVKDEVKKLRNFIRIQQVRAERGLKTSPVSYHCVFTGNPGTGKTTVARIIARVYKDLGILAKGHLVETDRSGLVAEYVGQTAVKTNKIIDSALDGVLFIDEAYSLVQGSGNDYGLEAIATLLKRMEDDRKRLVVILAGYGNEMKGFIDANPGLQSRFNRYIHFEDYSQQALADIFMLNLSRHDYRLAPTAEARLHEVIADAYGHKDKNFGNARYVRNLFEKTIENQATRLAVCDTLTEDDLRTILPADIAG